MLYLRSGEGAVSFDWQVITKPQDAYDVLDISAIQTETELKEF